MRKCLLIVTAVGEGGTGLLLLFLPSAVLAILLGLTVPAAETLVVGRVTGAALLCIGLACWLMRNEPSRSAQQGLLTGVLVYDLAAAASLAYSGAALNLAGSALWPAVALHGALAAWCVACLLANHDRPQPTEAEQEPTRDG